jgi:hypothetical protein
MSSCGTVVVFSCTQERFMNRILSLVVAVAVAVVAGCSGNSGGGGATAFKVTSLKDGQVIGVSYQEPTDAKMSKEDVTAVAEGGKLTWTAKVSNPGKLRCFARGILTIHTDVNAVVDVEFSQTIDAGKTETIGEKGVVVKDMPKDWKVMTFNAALLPGAGCVTCTCAVPCGGYRCAGTPANWTPRPLVAEYKVAFMTVAKALPELRCKISDLTSETTDNKGVNVKCNLTSNADTEVIYKVILSVKTSDGRKDSQEFAYSLEPGEKKEVKAFLAFAKPFKDCEAFADVNGKPVASVKKGKVAAGQ